jgi:Uma2 family endonuclease
MSSAERQDYVSVEDYLAMEEQALTKSEYIDGWVRAMTGATLRHNMVAGNCFLCLGNRLKGKPCRPFNSDTKVRIDQEGKKRFYYPDVQVVCESNEPTSVFQDQPVLILEVLSPATRSYDLDEKMSAYLTIRWLQYYIVLEQHQPIAIVMRRTDGGFLRENVAGLEATIDLPFLAFSLPMRELYDGIEFTADCVQEPELVYDVK